MARFQVVATSCLELNVGISTIGLIFVLLQAVGEVGGQNGGGGRKCQEISIPMCKDMAYNYTHYPNRFNHDTQEEAGLEVHQFWPLVEINCSPDLRFFLCSLYAPICLPTYSKPLPACRSVCERAKAGCAPLMRMYGFAWPERMKCEDLPEYGDPDRLCMDHNTTDSKSTPLPPPPSPAAGRARSPPPTRHISAQSDASNSRSKQATSNTDQQIQQTSDSCQCKRCPSPWLEVASNVTLTGHQGSSPNRRTRSCMLGCDVYSHFSSDQKQFSQYWLAAWSLLSCLSSVSTLLTFLIDTSRFKYPERSIVYMCVCYVFVSVGYMLPLVVDRRSIACHNLHLGGDEGEGHWVLRVHTRGPPACTLTFVLVYYFGMAASLWWVILSLTWFLAAGLKWSQEAIARYAQYYHLVAWLLPCIASVIVIATSQVDGDPISGICYVGGNNVTNLRGFILAPLGSCLALGVVFLAAGFVSLFRIRKVIRQQQEAGRVKTERFEKLMVRIGVFSLLYTLPAAALLACHLYEDHLSDTWLLQPPVQPCICKAGGGGGGASASAGGRGQIQQQPEHAVFMLKYLMSLIVGVTSGIWVWTGKTVTTWRAFCGRLFCCCKDGGRVARHSERHHHDNDRDDDQWGEPCHLRGKYGVPLPPLPPPAISPSSGLLPTFPVVGSVSAPRVGGMKLSQSYSNFNCYTAFAADSVSLLPPPLPHDAKHLLPVNHM